MAGDRDLVSARQAAWILGLGSLWLVAETLLLGPFGVLITASNGEFNIPGLLATRFESGQPDWFRFLAGGADHNIFTYFGSLDVFLFNVLSGWLAHSLRAASVVAAGCLGAYGLARRTLGVSRVAALFAAFAFAINLQMILFDAAQGYLLLLLLALRVVLEAPRQPGHWVALAAAVLLFGDTTYYSQLVPWGLGSIVAWHLFVDPRRRVGEWALILGVVAFLFVFRLDNFAALMAEHPLSQVTMVRGLRSVADAIQAMPRGLFLQTAAAAAATALMLAGLILSRGASRQRLQLIVAGLLLAWIGVPVATALQNAVVQWFPVVQGYRMGYIARIGFLMLPFAAAIGIDALLSAGCSSVMAVRLRQALLATAFAAVAFMSVKAKWAAAYNWVSHGSYTANFDSPVLKDLARRVDDTGERVRVEGYYMYSSYLNAYGLETFGSYHALHLRPYYEYWGMMVDPWAASIGPDNRYYVMYRERRAANGGWLAFRDDRLWLTPAEARISHEMGRLYHLNMMSLANIGYIVSRERLDDPSLEALHTAPRSWSEMTARERVEANLKANFLGREHLFVYRNKDVLPRYFAVGGVRSFADERALLEAVAAAPVADLRANVYAQDGRLPAGLPATPAPAEVRQLRDGGDAVELEVDARGGAAVVVAANAYSPYWFCEIDGVATPVFPAYHTFWGVVVPEGRHRVVFRYRPPYRGGRQ
ncbi:MAG: hypothetical protein HY985_01950 [Magnetospirillum sp.]|nr:hypothetical protein [Magnetospirillum sp.]